MPNAFLVIRIHPDSPSTGRRWYVSGATGYVRREDGADPQEA